MKPTLFNNKLFQFFWIFIIFIAISNSCYNVRQITNSDIINEANERTIIIHSDHSELTPFELKNPSIADLKLTGYYEPDFSTSPKANKGTSKSNKRKVINVYADFVEGSPINNQITIPLDNIIKAEVKDLKVGSTLLLTGAAITATILLVSALKDDDPAPPPPPSNESPQSCPFIYVNNGTTYDFIGEIYAGATAPELERHDYLYLPSFAPIDGKYNIKMTNELMEVQYTNLVELYVIDHQKTDNIIVDKYGKAYNCKNLQAPISATSENGRSILNEILYNDDYNYVNDIFSDTLPKNAIYLTFDRPANSNNAKLVVIGKNTIWLDYIFKDFIAHFGKKYAKWEKKRRPNSTAALLEWMHDQGVLLSASIKTNTGWQAIDYFNVTGSTAEKKDVLSIDLTNINSTKIEIKLETGFLFWELNYISMDFSDDVELQKIVVKPESVTDLNNSDLSSSLLWDDDKYLIQPELNSEAYISFQAPEIQEGYERSIFLHGKGHYRIISNSDGKPDISFLKRFKEPGALMEHSRNTFNEFYQHLNN
ncbi:hypothetical protein [Mangrovibacterium lignilyticum]|uniref:hypothetical protein n=1 Tax=Mangrovibacterium lignilyticum TaxID=2668052 RepID=UPI0013D80117|nr:hypothetical protein [Mangrovibacterium lignilyticum]